MPSAGCTLSAARVRLTRVIPLFLIASIGTQLTSCGGAGGDPTAPPTQPPVQPPVTTPTIGTVPASITVMGGDGQTGEPGTTLPVQPRVQVKDATGLVVPSVSVTFSIDSGSGTLEHVTAATGAATVAVIT